MAEYQDVLERWRWMSVQARITPQIIGTSQFQDDMSRLQDDIESMKGSDSAGYGMILATIMGDAYPPQPKDASASLPAAPDGEGMGETDNAT